MDQLNYSVKQRCDAKRPNILNSIIQLNFSFMIYYFRLIKRFVVVWHILFYIIYQYLQLIAPDVPIVL